MVNGWAATAAGTSTGHGGIHGVGERCEGEPSLSLSRIRAVIRHLLLNPVTIAVLAADILIPKRRCRRRAFL